MQLLIIARHVSFWSLDAANGLTEGMPVLIQERRHPSAVSHIRGVYEGAHHTSSSARSVSSSAPARITASRKSVVNFGFSTFTNFHRLMVEDLMTSEEIDTHGIVIISCVVACMSNPEKVEIDEINDRAYWDKARDS